MGTSRNVVGKAFTEVLKPSWILPLVGLGALVLAAAAGAAVLEVKPVGVDTMPEGTVEKVQAIEGIATVEKYLLVRTQPHDVIGIEPGAPLRLLSQEGKLLAGTLERGKNFRKEDQGKPVAIVSDQVAGEDYGGGMGGMSGMRHALEIGQTFKLRQESPRIRVVGEFSARPKAEAAKVFLPLATAQNIFGLEGKVTHLFATVQRDAEQVARSLQTALGPAFQVTVR